MNTAYHFIGLDIHKHVVAFCTKRGDGETIGEGKFRANRAGMEDWAAAQTTPWIGGMEATLFTGFAYDVLHP